MAKSKVKPICFIDAQQMSQQHPQTFDAPTLQELSELKAGDFVKVCVNNKERFWIRVQKIRGEEIKGVVDNVLVFADEFSFDCDDIITVQKKNVYSILQSSRTN